MARYAVGDLFTGDSSIYQATQTPGALPRSSPPDAPMDARGIWEEAFFFRAGEIAYTPMLPRRGADFVLVQYQGMLFDGANKAIVLDIPGARPDTAIRYAEMEGTLGIREIWRGFGACVYQDGAWGFYYPGYLIDGAARTFTCARMPIPPVFRARILNHLGEQHVVPAGGAWIRAIGYRLNP